VGEGVLVGEELVEELGDVGTGPCPVPGEGVPDSGSVGEVPVGVAVGVAVGVGESSARAAGAPTPSTAMATTAAVATPFAVQLRPCTVVIASIVFAPGNPLGHRTFVELASQRKRLPGNHSPG
jgi:hypothetical protein